MIRITKVEENTLYTELTTAASPEEMEQTYETGVELMETYDTVNVYEDVSLSGRDLLAIRSKTSQEFDHGDELEFGRVAVVGGGLWMKVLVHLWKVPVWPLVPDDVRYFSSSDADTARKWIQQSS